MRFTKMQGVGNDFVVVAGEYLPPDVNLPALVIRTCDRKFGIGADGLLTVSRETPDATFRMRMFNPDGTEDTCGNGLRCVSLWAHRAGWLGGHTEFTVRTAEGVQGVRLLEVGEDGRFGTFGVEMGIPKFEPADLPFVAPPGDRIIAYPFTAGDKTYPITVVNTGSTHTVIFDYAPPDEETFQMVSPLIENHPLFPERTSVLWAVLLDESRYGVRIWERGAGETLGCGTGACAVGVAAIARELSGREKPIDVVSAGGTLRITWPDRNASVDMVGPAQIVYDGVYDL